MLKSRTKFCFAILLSASVSGLLAAGCSQTPETETTSAPPAPNQGGPGRMGDPGGGRMEKVAANATGAEIFQQKCQRCHGENGEGKNGPKLINLDDTDAQLQTIIRDGHDKMPAFAQQLTDAQIDLVIAHLRTLKGN